MLANTILFASLLSFTDVTAALYGGKWCPRACDLTLDYATFNDTDVQLPRKVRSCQSELRITSLYLCLDEYCKEDSERQTFLDDKGEWCKEHAHVTLPGYEDVVDRWTPEVREGVKKLSADEALKFPSLAVYVVPDDRFFERAITTLVICFSFLLPSSCNTE